MDTRSFHRERSARAVLYVLHSGALFGTERMAIATLRALGPDCDSLLLAPPGAALAFARAAGLRAAAFGGVPGLCARMAGFMRGRREVALLATGVSQSLAGIAVAAATGTRLRHLHLVHGGTDERLSYGRKKWLRAFCVDFVAVSDFVRGRLTAHGVPGSRIEVIENFLSAGERPRRAPFAAPVARAVVVSRLDPIKRVDVLLDALGSDARLRGLPVDVLGTGWQAARLRSEAEVGGLAVSFQGFCEDVPGWLARSDLLVHTCPEEPFGWAVREAMAAGSAVLVPDRGGPAGFVREGETGFVYRANDVGHLAARLNEILAVPPARLNQMVAAARAMVAARFDPQRRVADYRRLIGVAA